MELLRRKMLALVQSILGCYLALWCEFCEKSLENLTIVKLCISAQHNNKISYCTNDQYFTVSLSSHWNPLNSIDSMEFHKHPMEK